MCANGRRIVAVLLLAGWAGAAAAAPCYVVYDRNDAVIFRDFSPPFDLSDPKASERVMMRQRGQHLLIAEFDNCNPVGFISPVTGGTAATVDEIVMQLKPAIGSSISNTGGIYKSQRPGMQPVTAAPSAPAGKPGY